MSNQKTLSTVKYLSVEERTDREKKFYCLEHQIRCPICHMPKEASNTVKMNLMWLITNACIECATLYPDRIVTHVGNPGGEK